MVVEVIGVVALAVALVAIVFDGATKYYALVVSTLLSSAAAVVLPSLGTVSIQPAHLILLILAIPVFCRRGNWAAIASGLRFPNAGFWLVATLAYGAAGAYLFPRLFGGATEVNPIGTTEFGPSLAVVPLGPTSGNFTQTVYFAGDVVCFLTAYVWAAAPRGVERLANALVAYAIGNVLFAAADLATFWTGTTALLDFMRNAVYTLHNETVVYGLKRIVGSFTEASSFAYASLGAFGFVLPLWLGGYRPLLTSLLSITTLLLLVFSTSSTAYAALPVFLALVYADAVYKMARRQASRATVLFVIFAPLVLVTVMMAVLLQPTLKATVMDFLNLLIFDKDMTESGIDRGRWNESAIRNVFDTYGLGAGIGSVRASSFALAALSNLGLFGTLTYAAFLACVLIRTTPVPNLSAALIRDAVRFGCLALLIAGLVSGALIDLGLPFFIMAGLGVAINDRARRAAAQPPGTAAWLTPWHLPARWTPARRRKCDQIYQSGA